MNCTCADCLVNDQAEEISALNDQILELESSLSQVNKALDVAVRHLDGINCLNEVAFKNHRSEAWGIMKQHCREALAEIKRLIAGETGGEGGTGQREGGWRLEARLVCIKERK